ncbi:MAG: rod shape-determining protein MreC [Oscillospiraceae bacterium]|nr:rod shape-determining protein MreC [Oscillospiraceae bacterium]
MSDFIKSVRFKILLAILSVIVGFMIMAVYTGGAAPLFTQAVSLVTVPVQRLSAGISRGAADFFSQFTDARALRAENELLREERNGFLRALADYERLRHENEQFRRIVGVLEERRDLVIEPAPVIAREPGSRFYSFTIGKGRIHGIKRLDPVMTAEGLVGYVIESGPNYARVATILDVAVNVGAYDSTTSAGINVYDSSTRDIGVISGTIELAAQGLCQINYLPRDSTIAVGDIIMTGGGSMFPKDILVGTVERVAPNAHGTSVAAVIRPAADIPVVKDVFVITRFEGQGER